MNRQALSPKQLRGTEAENGHFEESNGSGLLHNDVPFELNSILVWWMLVVQHGASGG